MAPFCSSFHITLVRKIYAVAVEEFLARRASDLTGRMCARRSHR